MVDAALARFAGRRRLTFSRARSDDVRGLDPAAQAPAIAAWQGRHANERASVALAERLKEHAIELGLADPIQSALDRLAEDERAHVTATAAVLEAFAAPELPAQALRPQPQGESAVLTFARDVLIGLVLSETVSASRFAAVRTATDIATFRSRMDALLRDEIAHASLGFHLLPTARSVLAAELGAREAARWLVEELMAALAEQETVIGLDGARKGLLPRRPQPPNNAGFVEPNVDAIAFYDAVTHRVLPRLETSGVSATARWNTRLTLATRVEVRS
jgi:hypothetical protein